MRLPGDVIASARKGNLTVEWVKVVDDLPVVYLWFKGEHIATFTADEWFNLGKLIIAGNELYPYS